LHFVQCYFSSTNVIIYFCYFCINKCDYFVVYAVYIVNLHSWYKPHLIWVIIFSCIVRFGILYFVEDLCICAHERYWLCCFSLLVLSILF
jgi:hypothetical protein